MNGPFKICKTFLLFALIVCATGGCAGKSELSPVDVQKQAFDDLRSELREVIDNPQRAAKAIALLDDLEDELMALGEKILARQTSVIKLNSNYDTTRAEFDEFFAQGSEDIRMTRQRVGKIHRAILAVTTPEEWGQISKARTKAMTAVFKANPAI